MDTEKITVTSAWAARRWSKSDEIQKHSTVHRLMGVVVSGASTLCLTAGERAAAQTLRPDINVAVFPEL